MSDDIINVNDLPGNVCFGCGHDNPRGLQIELRFDREGGRITGMYTPDEHMCGFPGVVHGGLVYTVLDCVGAWTASTLRPERALWILRSSQVTYHRPALPGARLSLVGRLDEPWEEWREAVVIAEALTEDGSLMTSAAFKLIPLSVERWKEVTGNKELPENWRVMLDNVADRGKRD